MLVKTIGLVLVKLCDPEASILTVVNFSFIIVSSFVKMEILISIFQSSFVD